VWWFDPAEVEALVRAGSTRQRRAPVRVSGPATAGDAAARVFRMFGQGKSLREIVVATRQTPERVRELVTVQTPDMTHPWAAGGVA
jgi:hypothetical protein